jgi:fumarate reductase subunit D
MLRSDNVRLILVVVALVIIVSFLVEASVGAPIYAFIFSAIGAVFLIVALVLDLLGRRRT